MVYNDTIKQLTIGEIAYRLGHIVRYAGAVRRMYTVLQHSIFVHRLVQYYEEYDYTAQLVALLHDAPEALTGDINKLVKDYIRQHTYALDALEQELFSTILATVCPIAVQDYELRKQELNDIVKQYDDLACECEFRAGITHISCFLHAPQTTVQKQHRIRRSADIALLRAVLRLSYDDAVDAFVYSAATLTKKLYDRQQSLETDN